jgi:hypothetical protein
MEVEGLLSTRKFKFIKRQLQIQNTNEANILMYLFFREYLPNHGKCIFELMDEHAEFCTCNVFRRVKCSDFFDFHKDYETFKGFYYYRKQKKNIKYQEKAIYHLLNHSVLKFLTYLPLYNI